MDLVSAMSLPPSRPAAAARRDAGVPRRPVHRRGQPGHAAAADRAARRAGLARGLAVDADHHAAGRRGRHPADGAPRRRAAAPPDDGRRGSGHAGRLRALRAPGRLRGVPGRPGAAGRRARPGPAGHRRRPRRPARGALAVRDRADRGDHRGGHRHRLPAGRPARPGPGAVRAVLVRGRPERPGPGRGPGHAAGQPGPAGPGGRRGRRPARRRDRRAAPRAHPGTGLGLDLGRLRSPVRSSR